MVCHRILPTEAEPKQFHIEICFMTKRARPLASVLCHQVCGGGGIELSLGQDVTLVLNLSL